MNFIIDKKCHESVLSESMKIREGTVYKVVKPERMAYNNSVSGVVKFGGTDRTSSQLTTVIQCHRTVKRNDFAHSIRGEGRLEMGSDCRITQASCIPSTHKE